MMGRNDSDTDAVNKGQQGIHGRAVLVAPDAGVQRASWSTREMARRAVLYATVLRRRVFRAGSPTWTAIRDFKVNAPAAPSVLTDAPAFKTAVG
ncbi:MAG: hypothetical protein ACLT8E_10365 [Akkermansia sp.]